MAAAWDVFFSYRRHDLGRAQPLVDALDRAGVRVWIDRTHIADYEPISDEIRRGLANSKAFLAFYSRTYLESKPCQQESTSAWLAAQQIDPNAYRRFWVVNPEDGFDHIPELLRDQNIPPFTGEDLRAAAIAEVLKGRLDALDATLLGSGVRKLPDYRGMSPDQARYFTGRARELWDLHGKLTANRISIITGVYGQPAAQVRGLGGNGKSLLAREYSIRFGPAYSGGVFWLSAYGNDDAEGSIDAQQREALRQDQIREFAIRSGVPVEGLKPVEIETAFWQAIARRGEPCLWIVDDLPSGLSPGELESVWNARWAGASTLITTRSKEYGARGSALDLGVLSPEEAFGLLGSRRKPANGAEESAARRIVGLLGYHPLAVEVAASYLGLGVEGFESYAAALEDPREDAVEFGSELKESLPTGHERSIAATLVKSIQQLGPEGMDFLRLASVLAVAPIQVGFVAEVFDVPEGAGRGRAVKAVDQAGSLSLCEPFGADAKTVHTLVSRTMRFRFPDEERAKALRSAAIRALSERLARVGHIGEHFRIAMDMPHARHLVAGAPETEDEATLALWVARRGYERGDYASARKLEEQVLEARRRLLGGEHRGTLTAMGNLATTLHVQGDLAEARKLEEQVLEASRHVLGEGHPDTLTAMNNLAATLHDQGDLAGARTLEEQVLEASRHVLGEEHPDTLRAMLNLAATLSAQGDVAGARKLEEQALAARRRLLGEEHPDTLTAMNNLAETLYAQGDLAGARKLQEQVLVAFRRVLGEEHPDALTAMNNLAAMLRAQGDLAGARKLEERVLAARRRVLGEEHPDTLVAMGNLAVTLLRQGDMAGARKLEEQVLAASRRVLGEEHPDTLRATGNLAEALYAQGDMAGARKLQEQVLGARRHVLGEGHPDTLRAMGNLAFTLSAQGDLAETRKLQERALEASRRVLGEEHPDTLTAMGNLALTLSAQDDLTGARKLQEQVLAATRRVLGEEHPDTLTATNNLAQTLGAQGDLAGARRLEEQVLAARRRLLGEEHPDTLTAMGNLAVTLYSQGDLAEARRLAEQALAARRRVLGEEHPDTVLARNNLAQITANMQAGGGKTADSG